MEFPVTSQISCVSNLNENYDFFQLLQLLEQHCLEHGKKLEQEVFLSPAEPVSFPSAAVRETYIAPDEKISLRLNFMGLYGVDSALPHYFIAQTLADSETAQAIKHFLNIINQRVYFLLYLVWRKYNLTIANSHQKYLHYLIALSGNRLQISDQKEFSNVSLLTGKTRSAIVLEQLLQSYLQKFKVQVQEFVPEWIKVTNSDALGSNNFSLGQHILLGERVLDVGGCIDIIIGPMFITEAKSLFSYQVKEHPIISLIKRYLAPLVEFRLILLLTAEASSDLRLGDEKITLTWDVRLGAALPEPFPLTIYSSKLAQI